ncbi:hypothetical protein [Glycomyces halotolerans]
MTIDGYLGEFRRGPALFTVHRIAEDPARYRVECNDGNGPSPVCYFFDSRNADIQWHGAWRGDEWCDWIESEARRVVKHPD